MKTSLFLIPVALSALCFGIALPASAQTGSADAPPSLSTLSRLDAAHPPMRVQYLRPSTLEITTKAPADKRFDSAGFRRQLAGFGLSSIIADAVEGNTKPLFSLVSGTGFGVDTKALNPIPADYQIEGQILRYGYEQGGGSFGLGAARSYTFTVRVGLQLKMRQGDSYVPIGHKVEAKGRVTKKGQAALFSSALDASTLREATVLAFANAIKKNDGEAEFFAPLYAWRPIDAPTKENQEVMEAPRLNRVAFFPKDDFDFNEESVKSFPILKMRQAFVDIDDFSEKALSVAPALWSVEHLSPAALRYFAAAHRANTSLDNLTQLVKDAPEEAPAASQEIKTQDIGDISAGDRDLFEPEMVSTTLNKPKETPQVQKPGQDPPPSFDEELSKTLNELDYIFYARLSDFSLFQVEKDNKRQTPYATVGIELCAIDPRRPTAGYVSVIGTGTIELPAANEAKEGECCPLSPRATLFVWQLAPPFSMVAKNWYLA